MDTFGGRALGSWNNKNAWIATAPKIRPTISWTTNTLFCRSLSTLSGSEASTVLPAQTSERPSRNHATTGTPMVNRAAATNVVCGWTRSHACSAKGRGNDAEDRGANVGEFASPSKIHRLAGVIQPRGVSDNATPSTRRVTVHGAYLNRSPQLIPSGPFSGATQFLTALARRIIGFSAHSAVCFPLIRRMIQDGGTTPYRGRGLAYPSTRVTRPPSSTATRAARCTSSLVPHLQRAIRTSRLRTSASPQAAHVKT